jgi:hypothetical protein
MFLEGVMMTVPVILVLATPLAVALVLFLAWLRCSLREGVWRGRAELLKEQRGPQEVRAYEKLDDDDPLRLALDAWADNEDLAPIWGKCALIALSHAVFGLAVAFAIWWWGGWSPW